MPRGSRIVDARHVVQNVSEFYVAYEGVKRFVASGFIVHQGVIRQFWPSTMPTDPSPIVLSTAVGESYDVKTMAEGQPVAKCEYHAYDGTLRLSQPYSETVEVALAPQPRQRGAYLVRFDVVSGTFVTGDAYNPLNTWVDVYNEGSLGIKGFYLANTTGLPGTATGQATFRLAQDNGFGAPLAGTEVAKTINFTAELLGDQFIMQVGSWFLSDSRTNETAVTRFTVHTDTYLRGYEGSAETYTERYAVTWGSNYQVKATVVSGSVEGDNTGEFLPIDVLREWYVEADEDGENLSAELDITITNGTREITKRVTFNSQRGDEIAQSTIDTDFTRYDQIRDIYHWLTGLSGQIVRADISINPDGTVDVERSFSGDMASFPQRWNTANPPADPENFEARVVVIDGEGPHSNISDETDTWLNLSEAHSWGQRILPAQVYGGEFLSYGGNWQLQVREVGRPDTTQTKSFLLSVAIINSNPPPGGQIP